MVLACYLSSKIVDLPIETTNNIKEILSNYYGKVTIDESDYAPIIELLKYDKKNNHGNINFVLLKGIGEPVIDCKVEDSLILDSFKFYEN